MSLVDPKPLSPVVFVTGKGGVGKTTVAAGLAVAAVQDGGDAVFVEFSDGASGERALGRAGRRVKRVVIEPHKAVIEAARPLFGSSMLTRLALDNFAMKPFLGAAPAVRELAVLALVQRTVDKHPGARIVVDMPATGHSVAWLRVPAQGRDLIRVGPLYELCKRLSEELVTPAKSSVVVVTLPQALVLQETLELCRTLTNEVGLTASRLIVNRVPTHLPQAALVDARVLAQQSPDEGERQAAAALARVLELREAISTDLEQTLLETLGDDAASATLLPRAGMDPPSDVVAAWLAERGAA
jgi:arsenite/tail-anchored protein-transporting ATPase